MNIAKSFLSRALSHPELRALTCGKQTLTYGQLAQRVHGLAGGLLNTLHLAPGARVILCMENRNAFIEVLFATWTAGLCAVPVNAKLHPREVKPIALDSGAAVIFTSASLYAGLAEALADLPGQRQLIVVDDDAYEGYVRSAPVPCASMLPDDLAWIFYTSGTTGVPKGAMLSHRNLITMSLQYGADVDCVRPGQTMLHVAPLSHGAGLYALPHLFGGGHQVIETSFSTDLVFEALQQYPDVTLFAAPTMLSRMIRSAEGIKNPAGNLLTVFYGGGPMYVEELRKSMTVLGPVFSQIYGQGEAPVTITGMNQAAHGTDDDAILGSVGWPRSGIEVRVTDADGKDLPAGAVGEILCRGDVVMAGYWRNPAATAETLRDGWLHTGDMGSFDERGCLTLRDRSKDVVISGGSNIYPREVEEVLLLHPAVAKTSVVGRPDTEWGEVLIAFVVRADGTEVSTAELDAHCLEHIARFKRPKEYKFLDELPTSSYGKVLKSELRKLL